MYSPPKVQLYSLGGAKDVTVSCGGDTDKVVLPGKLSPRSLIGAVADIWPCDVGPVEGYDTAVE